MFLPNQETFAVKAPRGRKASKKKAARIRDAVHARRDAWAENRGHYRKTTAFIPADGQHQEAGNFKVLKNYAETVIDGWLDDGEFPANEVRTISMLRDFWAIVDRFNYRQGMRSFASNEDNGHMSALKRIGAKSKCVPQWKWQIFENVVRWGEPTGVPGSKIANVHPASIEAAKRIVGEVARELA